MKLAWIWMLSLSAVLYGCGGDASHEEGSGGSASSSASGTGTGTGTGTGSSTGGAGAMGGESSGGAGGEGQGGGTAGGGGESQGGSGGGDSSATCQALAQMVVSDPTIEDADADGNWSPGEQATITLTLTNNGADMFDYPGVVIESSHPGVTTGAPNWLFGIFGGDSTPIPQQFSAAASVPSGTTVTFTATPAALNETCLGLSSFVFEATIED